MKPSALTYTQMMNGGRQKIDDADHAREQELQQLVQDLEREVAQLEQALRDQGSNSIPLDRAVS